MIANHLIIPFNLEQTRAKKLPNDSFSLQIRINIVFFEAYSIF